MTDTPVPVSETVATSPAGVESKTTSVTPGWHTSEHLLSLLAIIISACLASGLIPTDGAAAKIAGIAGTVLAAMGYTAARAYTKANA